MDCVLTPGELIELMEEKNIGWDSLEEAKSYDPLEIEYTGFSDKGGRLTASVAQNGGSGGYAEYIFRHAAKELFGKIIEGPLDYQMGRNPDMKEVYLEVFAEHHIIAIYFIDHKNVLSD